MKRLILMRHGKAERSSPGGDVERVLTGRGLADALIMGRLLVDEGLVPDIGVVSAARRTQQTWAAASESFPKAQTRTLGWLYNADASRILFEAEAAGVEHDTVMMVGHNPGMHALTVGLLREAGSGSALIARAESRFPTATVAAFTFDAAGRPAYDGLFYVADHGGGGGE